MSFTGMLSLVRGASEQFRTEVNNAQLRLDKEAEVKAKEAKDLLDFKLETDKFNREMLIKERDVAVKESKQLFDEYKFNKEHNLNFEKFLVGQEQWEKEYYLSLDDYSLKVKDLESRIKKSNDQDEIAKLELALKNEIFNWNKKQDDIKNKYKLNEFDWQKTTDVYKLILDAEKNATNAKKGTILYDDNLSFNFNDYSTGDERHRNFLSYMNTNLTKEIIDGMTVENKKRLSSDLNANFSFLLDSIAMKTEGNEGKYRDIFGSFNIDNVINMYQYLGNNLKEDIRNHASTELSESGVEIPPNNLLVESQIVENPDGSSEAIISTRVYDEKAEAKNAGFESVETYNAAINTLASVNKKINQKNAFFSMNQMSLSPFEDAKTLISTMDTAGIDKRVLQLAPFYNEIQESRHDNILLSTNWDSMVDKAFDIGILQIDKAGNIQGEETLVKFLNLVQPKAEYSLYTPGVDFIAGSNNPSVYGRGDEFKVEDYKLQNASARQAIGTTDELIKVIKREDTADLIGASLNIASAFYGGATQFNSLTSLFSGGSIGNMADGLNIVDGQGNVATDKINEINDQISKAGNDLLDVNLSDAAKKKAKLTLLKFTLAYQVSMALQGGSGGRTISDQDVDNILKGLSLSEDFFSFDTQDKTLESLFTLREFLEGIELKTRFIATGNTMKNIRTYDATQEIISAVQRRGGVGTSSASFAEKQTERNNLGLTTDQDEARLFVPNNYNKTWGIRRGDNGTPIYVDLKGGVRVPGSEKYIPADIFNDMVKEIPALKEAQYTVVPYEKDKITLGGTNILNILGK